MLIQFHFGLLVSFVMLIGDILYTCFFFILHFKLVVLYHQVFLNIG